MTLDTNTYPVRPTWRLTWPSVSEAVAVAEAAATTVLTDGEATEHYLDSSSDSDSDSDSNSNVQGRKASGRSRGHSFSFQGQTQTHSFTTSFHPRVVSLAAYAPSATPGSSCGRGSSTGAGAGVVSASVSAYVAETIRSRAEEASFLVTDLSSVARQVAAWRMELPMVQACYAVKCNPAPTIVHMLGKSGVHFDCATQGEMDLVVNELGFDPAHIVYANPAKMRNQIEFARDVGVRLTVFDSEAELHKLASVPVATGQRFRLLLRIATDDKDSICRFSNKFGALPSDAPGLLVTAKRLGLDVVGVSFHVGSGCGDATAYTTAMGHASDIFATARLLGFSPLSVVDIGGGFPGGATGVQVGMPSFADLAAVIRTAIAAFQASHGSASGNGTALSFIAEPGRFFVSDATTAVTRVYARKGADAAADAADSGPQAVYVDDGVYGTFNNVIYDHALPVPCKVPLQLQQQQCEQEQEQLIPSAVFGPTCDGLDQLCHADSTLLPRLQEGDWLMWADMGAYTHTASFVFNGYTHFPNNHFVQ